MVFSSLTFIFLFLPILCVFYFLFKKILIKNIILLIFSLIFYSWGEPIYIFLMIFSILITYLFSYLINKFSNHKKIFLVLAIIIVIGILGFYKYADFLINNLNILFNTNIPNLNLPLPIGISFYSFQILSYLIDLYKGKVKHQKNILTLALYISLFPQLVAGPIVRYETIEEELKQRNHNLENIIYGVKRFIIGLSKKIIIANQMAIIADSVFNYSSFNELGSLIIWIGAFAYTLQIYFDFSGYSDMAIGLGKIFGFNFNENFNYPYISKSITEFWRRWHISLSSWFKDYIYIPLGGNRKGKLKLIRNIIIVWFLTGLWHGAAWNFIVWGLYFACLLIIEKIFLNKILNKLPNFINWIYTMILIIISWVIFRANDLSQAFIYLKNMFSFESSNIKEFLLQFPNISYSFIYFIPAFIFMFPIIKYFTKDQYYRNSLLINIILLILFIIDVTFLMSSTYNPFIYFRF